MAAPITGTVLFILLLAALVLLYQGRHVERIYTGVMAWGLDLGGMQPKQAQEALSAAFPFPEQRQVTFQDTGTGREWNYSLAQLGLTFDVGTTVDAAYSVGRDGGPWRRLSEQFASWYYGEQVAPIVLLDEAVLDRAIGRMAAEINQPASDATLSFDGVEVDYESSQLGRSLDIADTRARLLATVITMQDAQIQLLIHETQPRVSDTSLAAQQIRQIMSGPMTFYLQEPLDGVDLEPVVLPVEEMVNWIRVHSVDSGQGQAETQVIMDENAIRAWLAPYEELLHRDPVNARFYFDDETAELVLVEPHVNGRELDVEATANLFLSQVVTPDRSMPFILREIVPVANSSATAEELGITGLLSESTTWFYGSSSERMHNIARAARNFYGIVIAPGQEFSFNRYLGEVSADQGYETGLIIFGGRTIEGVGGGVCQVSTTAFQAAFWAGYPITERWEHGYQVHYYDDGEGPGMDATVYAPLVDFRFINDTPYHLLIENYYSEANSSLTFKFYSTSLGRRIEKAGPVITDVVPAKPDIWELNDELQAGEIEQVDWAVEGAKVTVQRDVYNASGDLLRQDIFVSHYIPWQNIYQYGPGTEGIPGVSEPEPVEPEPGGTGPGDTGPGATGPGGTNPGVSTG
jgi:vancomycin resistance protein YoaR